MQHPDRIIAHLCDIGTTAHEAVIVCEGVSLAGRLEMPNLDHEIIFLPGAETFNPLARTPVEIIYRAHGHAYSFQSSIIRKDHLGRWLLQVPSQINSKDYTLVHSHKTLGDPGIDLELGKNWKPPGFRSFSLVSLSTYGLSTVFHSHQTPMTTGELVEARLLLPTAFTFIQLLLEVCGIYPWPRHRSRKLAKLRFVGLPLDRRKAIALSLAVWEDRKTHRGY